MYYVYVLKSCKTGKYYVGSTNNLERRLNQHNGNKTRSLSKRGPFEIVFFESYETLREARKRESQIKKFKGGNAFKNLIGSK